MSEPHAAVDGAGIRSVLPVVLGAVIGLGGLALLVGEEETDFNAFALGEQFVPVWAEVDGVPIHGETLDHLETIHAGYVARGGGPAVLWMGNSQLYVINQHQQDQVPAPSLLSDALRPQGYEVICLSPPNSSFEEHYLLWEKASRTLDVHQLVMPLVFDDLRETRIRATIAPVMAEPEIHAQLESTEIGTKILDKEDVVADSDLAGLTGTVQESVERAVVTWCEERSQLWRIRPEARGDLFVGLYRIRNTVLGIDPQDKRRLIKGRYIDNMAALDAIVTSATAQGVEVLMYVVPIRDDVERPYVESEYQQFKADARDLADRPGVTFADLEGLVPAEFWGSKYSTSVGGGDGGELDFMHFQAAGHELLAGAVFERLDLHGEGDAP